MLNKLRTVIITGERISNNFGIFHQFAQKTKCIHSSSSNLKWDERTERLLAVANLDQGTEGESASKMDSLIQSVSDMFPTENTPNMLFNGVPFSKIPVCNVKVSKNNTILSLNDATSGRPAETRSCGIEGFKNTRKGTNMAAQATAITFGTNIKKKGFHNIRVRVKGIGPGRISAIKGLEMAGLNIISITDNTPVSWNPPRPRKPKRL